MTDADMTAAGMAATAPAHAPEVCVVVPTYNERANVAILIDRLRQVLAGCTWEAVFVDDDSADGTAAAVRKIGETDARVRCIRRIGRRGLSGACIEGMLATQARYLAVMDADLQHDETLLAAMRERLRSGDTDLVVASRFLAGSAVDGLSKQRERASRLSNFMVQRLLGIALSDPMSGYFMIRRDAFEPLVPALSTQGFKLLLDIAATGRGKLRVAELPYTFGERLHGASKLDARVALDFGQLLLAKLTHDAISTRFVLFCLVGLTGVAVHMGVLALLFALGVKAFSTVQTIATVVAITWNFLLNNAFTYRDQRLRGWRIATGLVRFMLICGAGAISNVGIANAIYYQEGTWWLAGLAGAVVGAVWNYAVSSAFVWHVR